MRLLKIGRDSSCDITINSQRVSALHAEITLLNSGDILLEDKGSMNGTFVQNQRIQPGKSVNVRRGDAIRFGDVELQWSQIPIEDNTGYKAVWGIGTDFHNDFQVAGSTVSRFHATIKQSIDGKFFIFDHSRNGTTVDGRKIIPNNPQRIKKNSAVSCGGVPIDLKYANKIPWPSDIWKIVLASVASLLLLVCIGYGINSIITPSIHENKILLAANGDTLLVNEKGDTIVKPFSFYSRTHEWSELYAKYNHSVVMLKAFYHYEVSVEGMNMDALWNVFRIPQRFLLNGSSLQNISNFSLESLNKVIKDTDKENLSSATGFFISDNGELITNLHVVKPWLFNDGIKTATTLVKRILAERADQVKNIDELKHLYPLLIAGMSEVKVEGKLDYLALIAQGETFDENNILNCRVVSAGDDINKDVALVQVVSKRLPFKDCTFVDLHNGLELSADSVYVGCQIFTMGFPMGNAMQREAKEDGIKVISQNGTISQNLEFEFMHNASTTGGMSGSPIFNRFGKLIGVHHAGYSQSGLQGFNYGVKAKYVKELIENPHKK